MFPNQSASFANGPWVVRDDKGFRKCVCAIWLMLPIPNNNKIPSYINEWQTGLKTHCRCILLLSFTKDRWAASITVSLLLYYTTFIKWTVSHISVLSLPSWRQRILYFFNQFFQIIANNKGCTTGRRNSPRCLKAKTDENRFRSKVHTVIVDRARSADANNLPF